MSANEPLSEAQARAFLPVALEEARQGLAEGGIPIGAFFSGFSAIIASVVTSRPATEAASCSAVRTTFVGSMMPAFTRSLNSPV